MPAAVVQGAPVWTLDALEFEKQMAAFTAISSIPNQTQWQSFINGISTLPQAIQICKALLQSVKCSVP